MARPPAFPITCLMMQACDGEGPWLEGIRFEVSGAKRRLPHNGYVPFFRHSYSFRQKGLAIGKMSDMVTTMMWYVLLQLTSIPRPEQLRASTGAEFIDIIKSTICQLIQDGTVEMVVVRVDVCPAGGLFSVKRRVNICSTCEDDSKYPVPLYGRHFACASYGLILQLCIGSVERVLVGPSIASEPGRDYKVPH